MSLHSTEHGTVAISIKPFRACFLLLVAVLSGCASQVDMVDPITASTVVAPNQGIVVARIVNASGYPAPLNQLTITPQNLNTSEDVKYQRLQSSGSRLNGTSIFASPVAAGTYALTSLRAFHSNGSFYYSHAVPSGTELGTFAVAPGQVTDLGTLIYYQKPDGDQYFKEVIRIPEQPGEVLDKHFSFFEYDEAAIQSWNDDGLDDERNTFFASAAQNPTTFEDRYLAPDGSVYFLGKLGVILKRTPEGEWEMDVVDTNLDLTAIAQNERGDIVVGGAEGRLFIKRVDSDWTDLSIDHSYDVEHLMFLDADTIDMVALQMLKLSVLRSTLDRPQLGWDEINAFATMDGWKTSPPPPESDDGARTVSVKKPKRIVRSELHDIDGRQYISVYTQRATSSPLFSQATADHFAYEPSTWKAAKPELMPEIVTSIPAGKSKLGIQSPGFWSWSGLPVYSRYAASTDSWEEMNTFVYRCASGITTSSTCGTNESSGNAILAKKTNFSFRSVPWFSSERDAIAVVTFTDRDFWTGETDYDVKILGTNDGGLTWTDTGHSLPNDLCASFVPEVGDRILLSCSSTGDFYESTDMGASWEHVRQHENF
ncbi:MAG: hypothetical protein AAF290_17180 [Pseudomonadota bacterium]